MLMFFVPDLGGFTFKKRRKLLPLHVNAKSWTRERNLIPVAVCSALKVHSGHFLAHLSLLESLYPILLQVVLSCFLCILVLKMLCRELYH